MSLRMKTITIGICALFLVIGSGFYAQTETHAKPQKESVYERVIRTGKLRCGYFIESPFTMKDENTGEFSGLSVDLAKMLAKNLNLELEWTEEISFATFPQDLKNKRYDMVCGSVFVISERGKFMDYTNPYAFVSVLGYVRPETIQFDKDFDTVNWDNVKIAGLDGEAASIVAKKLLPQAKMEILSQLSSISEMLMLVSTGKADIGFVLPSVFENFNAHNPNKLRQAGLDRPLYKYAMSFGVARGQEEFKSMMNNALLQVSTSGELNTLFKKYDPNGYFEQP